MFLGLFFSKKKQSSVKHIYAYCYFFQLFYFFPESMPIPVFINAGNIYHGVIADFLIVNQVFPEGLLVERIQID